MKSAIKKISNNSGPAALIVALIALVVSTAGVATAVTIKGPSTKPRPYGVLVLDRKGKFPTKAIPTVKNSTRLGGRTAKTYKNGCSSDSVDIGTYCLMARPLLVRPADQGKNNYFYATKACASLGGWLPTAELLLGAVDKVPLAGTIDDAEANAYTDLDPTDGFKDRREMTATLVTTASGSSASGSEGVTVGSTGDPRTGEPNPVPLPANPQPETLQYVTVYDNHDQGGFAGSVPVSQPESFRCAFSKAQPKDRHRPVQ